MTSKNITKYSIHDKKKLAKTIETMPKEFQLEVYYYIYSNIDESRYTQNNNGLFININKLDKKIISELHKKVHFYKENEKNLIINNTE